MKRISILTFVIFSILFASCNKKAESENHDFDYLLAPEEGAANAETTDVQISWESFELPTSAELAEFRETHKSNTQRNFAVDWNGKLLYENSKTQNSGIKIGTKYTGMPLFINNSNSVISAKRESEFNDGTKKSGGEYFFENGNLVSFFNPENNPYDDGKFENYEYDSNGRVVRYYENYDRELKSAKLENYFQYVLDGEKLKCYFFTNKDLYGIWREEQTQTGYKLKSVYTSSDDVDLYKYENFPQEMEYGVKYIECEVFIEDGKVLKYIEKKKDGNEEDICTEEYSYENGLLKEIVQKTTRPSMDTKDVVTNKESFEYNSDGLVSKCNSMSYDLYQKKEINSVKAYSYDSHQNVIEYSRVDDDDWSVVQRMDIKYSE